MLRARADGVRGRACVRAGRAREGSAQDLPDAAVLDLGLLQPLDVQDGRDAEGVCARGEGGRFAVSSRKFSRLARAAALGAQGKKGGRNAPKPAKPGMLASMFSGISMNGTDGLFAIMERRPGARAVRGLTADARPRVATPGAKALTKAMAEGAEGRAGARVGEFRNATDEAGAAVSAIWEPKLDCRRPVSSGSYHA